jgi:hypothetical protein
VRRWGDGEREVLTGDNDVLSGGNDCGSGDWLSEGPAHVKDIEGSQAQLDSMEGRKWRVRRGPSPGMAETRRHRLEARQCRWLPRPKPWTIGNRGVRCSSRAQKKGGTTCIGAPHQWQCRGGGHGP